MVEDDRLQGLSCSHENNKNNSVAEHAGDNIYLDFGVQSVLVFLEYMSTVNLFAVFATQSAWLSNLIHKVIILAWYKASMLSTKLSSTTLRSFIDGYAGKLTLTCCFKNLGYELSFPNTSSKSLGINVEHYIAMNKANRWGSRQLTACLAQKPRTSATMYRIGIQDQFDSFPVPFEAFIH